jgi:signal transduction histidine kinase
VTSAAAALAAFAVGVFLTAGAANWLIARHLRRLRIAEQRARASERLAELGSMTGGLAHEIKNPLSTIGLNAQLLAEGIEELPIDTDDKGRLSRRIGALRREVDRLAGILSDFLEYAGELHIEPRPADLNQLVEELVDFYLPQAGQAGVRVRTDLAPGSLIVPVDAPMLKQAILNLMLNAVQAMGATPSAPGASRELIVRTRRDGPKVAPPTAAVQVIDTGPGMDAATLDKIFKPYFTTKSGGTGLGLPTARRIVEAHHGRIEAHSEPGRGTEFTITLPLSPE